MSDNVRSNVMTFLVGVIVIGTCYGLVADDPDRKVVDVQVTMTASEYAQALDRARKQGESDMMKRLRACTWQDTFSAVPPLKQGVM